MEERKIWYFTFGCGQVNEGKCQPILGTYGSARKKMFDTYGTAWAFQYSQEDWEQMKADTDRMWKMETELPLVEVEEV